MGGGQYFSSALKVRVMRRNRQRRSVVINTITSNKKATRYYKKYQITHLSIHKDLACLYEKEAKGKNCLNYDVVFEQARALTTITF